MDDLVQFLRARLDKDEQTAKALLNDTRPGRAPRWEFCEDGSIRDVDGRDAVLRVKFTWPQEAEHILRHQPVRVLAEVDAKRRLLAMHEQATRTVQQPPTAERRMAARVEQFVLEEAFRAFAVVYADHPDYRPEWAPDPV